MTPAEYAAVALVTHATDPVVTRTTVPYVSSTTVEVLPVYVALAMCGEAGEFAEKVLRQRSGDCGREIASELGDVMWYAFAAAEDLGVTLADEWPFGIADWTSSDPHWVGRLMSATGRFAERVKKSWRDPSRPFDRDAALNDLHAVLIAIAKAGNEIGYTLEQIAELNIKKCLDRRARGVVRGEGDHR